MDRSEILEWLRDRKDYVSGQEICEHFQVSRNAVWKAVEQLKKDGYVIEAVRNRGYRLLDEAGEVYDRGELLSRLHTRRIGREVRFFRSTDSTNLQAKAEAEQGAPEGTVFLADEQTAGRGRRGRSWNSPAGKNIYFSLLLRPEVEPEQAPVLTLLMALSIAKALEEIAVRMHLPEGAHPLIKWPNDVVMGGRKINGTLTEMSAEPGFVHYVVIGVGINVKKQDFPEELQATAGTLEDAFGSAPRRCELTARILEHFEELYERYLKERSAAFCREEYESFLVSKGRTVRVLDPAGEYEATALGIDGRGQLLVRTADGETRAVYAGEVSVRGLYGYT
ncbi:MAG: biotin--[acetyl-CoA-carboxylase] ligase [Lachnospiraceae bacterium]|nr:biotin--[acetyl-CoA-carboxylase] ligase [Lachnospiraceae bacterium]